MSARAEDAAALASAFLAAVNRQDVEAAQSFLAPQGELVFPGGTRFNRVADFLAWARPRYRSATYAYHAFDTVPQARPDEWIVYARGTIAGELNDGTAFQDVRCIDRFTIRGGAIESKEVWSDMADLLRRLHG